MVAEWDLMVNIPSGTLQGGAPIRYIVHISSMSLWFMMFMVDISILIWFINQLIPSGKLTPVGG